MNRLTSRGIRTAFALLLMAVGLAPAASAVTSEFSILMNTDVSPASGCDVPTANGIFQGVEQILITTVETTGTSTANVTQIERQVCVDPTTDAFGLRILVDGTDRPVGVGLGTGGSDVVETYFPLSVLPPPPPGPQIVRLGVTGENLTTGGLEDALLTSPPGNGPIQLVLAGITFGDIPTLSEWGLIFLGLMLAVAAVAMLKRRTAVTFLLALVLLAGAGIAWAAVSDLNGNTLGEWAGAQLATDPAGDAPAGADILAFYGMVDGGTSRIYFRLDVDLEFNGQPTANDQNLTTPEDTPLPITLTGTDPESDPLTFSIVTGPTSGTLTGTPPNVTYNPNTNFNGTDSFTFQVDDGNGGTDTGTVTITVTAANDPPVLTAGGGSPTFTEGSPAVTVDPGLTVADPDNANLASATVTISNPLDGVAEVLAAPSCAGLTVTPGVNSLTITGSQPLATYQTCLRSVTYENTSNTPDTTPRNVAFVVNDGTVNSNTATTVVNVAPSADAPVLAGTGTVNFTEDGGPIVVAPAITVADADDVNLESATVTIANPLDGAAEVLAATSCAGLTVTPGVNTLSITGSQPLATYQTCLQSVTYDNSSQDPDTTSRSVQFVANDGDSNGNTAVATVTITAVNDAPVVTTTAGSTAFTEAGGPVVVDSGVTVTDVDDANLASATVTITNPQDGAAEALAATSCAGLTVTPGLNTLSITGSQPLATYETCLQSVTYNNTSQDPDTTARVISFVANDGTVNSTPATKTVTIGTVDNAPVVTTTAGTTAFTEDGGPVVVDSGVTVTDADSANLASATVTITNPQDGAAEVLAATSCAGLTVTPGANTLSITGSQPLATYQTCLQSVTYNNTSQNPNTTARVISFVANDGTASSAPATKTVTMAATNDAPVVTTTGGNTAFTEDGGPVVVDIGVTVTDADSANLASATVTITNPQDGAAEVLAATSCAGLTVTPGLNTLSITGSQPPATYQTCLQSVTYNNTSQDPNTTARVISFVANDGTASSAPATKTVTVATVNDAPVVATTGGSTPFTEDGGAVVVDAGVTVTDSDSPNLASATVTITNPQDGAAEVLAATSCAGLTVTPGLNILSITGSQPPATYQTCLQSVTYNNTSQSPGTTPRVISFVANDGTASSVPATKTVTVAATNDAPVVTTTAGTTAFTEDGGPVAVDSGVTVTDADSANLALATVTITNPQDGAAEVLAATSCAGLTVTPGLNTLSITGSQSPATYQTCLQSVTYNNTSQNPDTTARVISFVASDGTASSAPATKTVTVAAVADAPVVTTTAGTTSFTEDAGAVVVDAGVTVTDGDSANLASATVTITNPQDGALETLGATSCAGLTVTPGLNTLSITGSQPPATYQTCLQSVTYNNTSQNPGTTPRVVSFVANDGTASSVPATKTVTVTPVNDAPVVTTTAGLTSFTEDGGPVVVDSGVTVSDVDNANLASATVTITNPQDGAAETLGATSCAGLTVTPGLNTLSITGSQPLATYQTCLQSVTYNNSSQNPNATNRTVSFVVNDGTANSLLPATKTVTVTPVPDAPTCSPLPGALDYSTPGNTQLHAGGATPLPGVASITDPKSALTAANASDVDGPAPITVVSFSGNTSGGDWVLNSDGSFTFVPDVGFTGAATLAFQVKDGANTAGPCGTITVNVGPRVWYIHDVTGANNPAGGANRGRSTNPFDTIAEFNAATTNNGDIIFVFEGNTGTTPHVGSITLKDGQKLWGQGIALNVPGFGTPLVNATNKPRIRTTTASTDVVSVPATAGNRNNVEIRGLDLEATGATSNAIDVTSSGGNVVGITISDDNIRGATAEGIDLNAGATGAFSATVQNNTITSANNGIDTDVNASGTTTVTASSNMITSTAGNAFDARTLAGASALRVAFNNGNVAAAGTGILIDGSAAGTTTITGFADNVVDGSTVGTGISVTSATFDTDTTTAGFQQVSGGTTVVGATGVGNGVGGSGILMMTVAGDLAFADLRVFAEGVGGAGLRINGTGAVNTGAGTGTRVTVNSAAPGRVIEATGGPAVDVNNATIDLQLSSLKSTTTSTGVSLVNVSDGGGTNAFFSAPSGSSVTASSGAGPAFNVSGGNAKITYGGTIINNGTGRAVSIATWSGDDAVPGDDILLSGAIDENGSGILVNGNGGSRSITFSGGMDIDTTTGEGFAATSNTNTGGLHITGTNTIDSTSATGLRVTNTTIGNSNLSFQHISSGNNTAAADPANGIVLNTTGSSGSLIVTGTGAADSGGTIQNTTGHGVLLTSTLSPSFTRMKIQNTAGSGVEGTQVTNFTFTNGTIDNSGTGGGADDSNLAFNDQATGTENNLSGTVTITNNTLTNARWHGIMIQNFNGTVADAIITGNTITSSTSAATSLGYGINLQILGSATTVSNLTRATISGNTVTNFPSAGGIQVQGGNSNAAGPAGIVGVAGSGSDIISIVSNQVRGQSAANRMATSAILYTVSGKGQGNVNVSNNGTLANPIGNNTGTTIGVGANGNTTLTATTNNNFVEANHPGTTGDSGISGGVGVTFGVTDVADMTWTINGNVVRNVDGNGILAVARGTNGTLKVKIQNNDVEAPQAGVRPGIRVDAGNTTAGTDNDVCLNISGNTSAGSGGSQGIGLRKQGTSTTVHAFGVNGMAATSSPGVEAYVDGLNPAGGSTLLISAASGFTNCSLP